MIKPLTCFSCEHWTPDGCTELGPAIDGFPNIPLTDCSWAVYLPGADQREDDNV